MNRIQVTRSSMPTLEEYIEEVAPLWESHWLTNMGVEHKKLEMALKERLGVENLALFTNGHNALECILEAMALPAGGEVITTPFTFASTTHAIVPVHVYGNLCDVDAIQEIADRHGLKVIYDAAHAFGVERECADGVWKSASAFGDAAMFSFHATKVFNTIEGGCVCFRDEDLYPLLNQWKNFGITGPEDVEYVGGNAKMNEFCAAMGVCNLRHLDGEIEKRKAVAERYWERLEGAPGVTVFGPGEGVRHNYAYLPVLFDPEAFGATRDDVFDALDPLVSDFACYRSVYSSDRTPVAKKAASQVLTLPMYADLALTDVDRICDAVLGGGR